MYLRNYCYVLLFLASLEEATQENPLIDENLFEGDIIGTDSDTILQLISQSNYDASNEDSTQFEVDGGRIGHGAPTKHRREHELWPDGKVYYKISEEFSSNEINFIQSAFNDFHRYTCIKLIERTDQPDYIKIERRGHVCSSWIGKKGGEQNLHLDSHCLENTTTAKGIAIHEIMHAIGFYHEQSRTDRDDYVEIFLDNLKSERMKQDFQRYELDKLQDLHTEYDYESIMHYGTTDFASDGKETIKPKKPGVRIGQRKGLSQIDIREINLLYKCKIVGPTTAPKVASKIEICWGTRFLIHQGSFRVDSWNECIQRCNRNSVCKAITFYDDKAYTNENCFLFNAATNYNTEYDPDLRYGSWKKVRNSFQCQQHNEFRWGTLYIKHYSKCSASGPNDCIKRCKQDNSCDAISFNSNTSKNENCYFFNARASGYDSKSDPTNKWGSWKKNEISSELIKPIFSILYGKRLKIDYSHINTRNLLECMLMCDQDRRCRAVSFDKSVANNNCYLFNSTDHFTSEEAEEHWDTWIKPTTLSSTKSTTETTIQWRKRLKTHYDHRNVKNYIRCKKLCNGDSRCHAISFKRIEESLRNSNCYFFNSADHFTSEDAEAYWGTWIKPTALPSTNSTTVFSILYGKRLKIDYDHINTGNLLECMLLCVRDRWCHAMSFDKSEESAMNNNCYLFNSADHFTSEDAEEYWGTWIKPTALPSTELATGTTIQWGKRLKIDYDHINTRNLIECKSLCQQDRRCHAMSFDKSEESARNNNCYLFNFADHFTSEDAEEHWGTWIKPTAVSSTSWLHGNRGTH